MNAPNHIQIWQWEDAPEELKALSTNGGGEEWVALIPPKLAEEWIPWLDEFTPFAPVCLEVHEHPKLPGYKVRIGCHS